MLAMRAILVFLLLSPFLSADVIETGISEETAGELLKEMEEEPGKVDIPEDDGEKSILEGDMIVPKSDSVKGMQASALKGQNYRWPNAEVPYVVLRGHFNRDELQAIANGMAHIQRYTCVRFRPAIEEDDDYVYIVKGDGCHSMVGRVRGAQKLSIGDGCFQLGTVVHEFLHALGFIHEQSRSDRDQYIHINWGNIQNGKEDQFERYNSDELVLMDTPYDYTSVMHYGSHAFSRNRQATIIPWKGGVQVGQRRGLSEINIQRVNRLYRCKTNGASRGPQWQKGAEKMYWAFACDFFGHDIATARTAAERCGGICSRHETCTHFVWSRQNGGTCYLKAGVPLGTLPTCLDPQTWPGAVCGFYGPPNQHHLTSAVNCQ